VQESVPDAQRIMNEACKAADPKGAIFAASTAAWAIYAFLKTPSDFWRTIFACIEVGGKRAYIQHHASLFKQRVSYFAFPIPSQATPIPSPRVLGGQPVRLSA
jgi:hypothetical protein